MQQSPNQTDAMQPLPLAKTSSIAPLEHEPVHVDEDIIVVKSTNRVPKKFEQFQRVMLQVNDHAERVIQKNPEKAEIMIQAMLKAVEMFEQNDTIDAGQVFEQLAKRNDKNLSNDSSGNIALLRYQSRNGEVVFEVDLGDRRNRRNATEDEPMEGKDEDFEDLNDTNDTVMPDVPAMERNAQMIMIFSDGNESNTDQPKFLKIKIFMFFVWNNAFVNVLFTCRDLKEKLENFHNPNCLSSSILSAIFKKKDKESYWTHSQTSKEEG